MEQKETKSYRKIIVGDNYSNCIRYVIGSKFKIGKTFCTLSEIITSEDNSSWIDLYMHDDDVKFLWKTVTRTPLEFEYNVNIG